MECKKCGYRLWNLRSRTCPECGTPFLPSQYEFVLNSVRFACPHCGEGYYGTGPMGHLVPPAFDCANCGRHINMDEMVLHPTAGVEEEQTQPDVTPWLESRKLGFFGAWLSTIGMALVRPTRLMKTIPEHSSLGDAWAFAILTNTTALLFGLGPLMLFPVILAIGSSRGGIGSVPVLKVGIALAFALVIVFLATILFLALWGAITHGLLRATGDTAGPMGRTYQALCYSSGANAVTGVPCVGYYFGWIWWTVSAILMVKNAQGVQGWRATLAVVTFPAVLIFCVLAMYALGILFVMARADAAGGG